MALRAVYFGLLFALTCAAQPFTYYRGVANAASYAPSGLPNGSIARGSIFTLFGRSFGPAAPAQVDAFPLENTLAGVAVEVCQSGACVNAIPLFVSAGQINAVMPSNAPLGGVSIRVRFNDAAGNFIPAEVVASSVGIFGVNSGGFGPAIVQNFIAQDNQPLNSLDQAARPGQFVTLWATGLGAALSADNQPPQRGDLPVEVEIFAGGKPVTNKLYSGRSPCCAGVDQIVFQLPDDTPLGCYVPIQIRTAGSVVSNSVSIAVSAGGSACSDPWNQLSQTWREGGNLGLIWANRIDTSFQTARGDREETVETIHASFRPEPGGAFAYNALASLPPPGTCTVHMAGGDLVGGAALPAFQSRAELDAGASLQAGTVDLLRDAPGVPYSGVVGGTIDVFGAAGLPATALGAPLTISSSGGADVGAFSVESNAMPVFSWEQRAQGGAFDRNSGAVIDLGGSAGEGNPLLVAAVSVNQPANASALFVCVVPPGDRSARIPSEILQALPASPSRLTSDVAGYLLVGALPTAGAGTFQATGLSVGILARGAWSARAVFFY